MPFQPGMYMAPLRFCCKAVKLCSMVQKEGIPNFRSIS